MMSDVTKEEILDGAHMSLEHDAPLPATAPTLPAISPIKYASKSTLRAGRWFPEEERYATFLVKEFKAGTLPLPEKITLREFLSLIFHCPPMRITKKFEGNNMIGKISYKRCSDMSIFSWWELKKLERKFWERMVKSRSPSALEAHAKMVEYSSHVFADAPDLSGFDVSEEQQGQQDDVTMDMNQVQSMFVQLQHMLGPVVGTNEAQQENRVAMANVRTLEQIQRQSLKNLTELEAMSEMPDLPHDRKALIDSARSGMKLDLEEIEIMLHETKDHMIYGIAEYSKYSDTATANMLTLQQMLHDSKRNLFRMEYKLSTLSEYLEANSESMKNLSNLVDHAKQDMEVLECQLSKMKVDIVQKYKQAHS